jgi:alanine racemase
MTPERTWIEVSLSALVANARTVMARNPGARLLPMVKADAYGLGAVPVARALEALYPWGFGVATVAEGAALRRAGIRRPILVVAPTVAALDEAKALRLTPGIGSGDQLARWLAIAPGMPFHLEVDTGMGRAGYHWETVAADAARVGAEPGFEGIYTHFHSADVAPATVREQRRRFASAVDAFPKRPALVHAANSAGALIAPEAGEDLVRPGIFLYGGAVPGYRPEPVVTWRARIIDARWREAGWTVSYGATYRTTARTCLATIAAGYADGVRRSLSGQGAALVQGRRIPFAGRVTMDMTVLEAGDTEPPPGAVATLLGTDGAETIALDEVAAAAGTISYEILTGLSGRVERVYT